MGRFFVIFSFRLSKGGAMKQVRLGSLAKAIVKDKAQVFMKVVHQCSKGELPIFYWSADFLYGQLKKGEVYRVDFKHCPECGASLSPLQQDDSKAP
jgi:hypothetical protein